MRILLGIFVMLGLLLMSSYEAEAQTKGVDPASLTNEVDKANCAKLQQQNGPGLIDDFISSGGAICPCTSGVWIERIIECFTSESYGVIPEVMKAVLRGPPASSPNLPSYKDFTDMIVGGSILLAIVLFGLNMIMGSIQSLAKDSLSLIHI